MTIQEDPVFRRPPAIELPAEPPRRCITQKTRLPDAARGMGVFFAATRGTGKSRTLGRVIAWHDFQRGIPLVVLDPVGGTIDNLLDKIGREPLENDQTGRERRARRREPRVGRRELWKRVKYVDMAATDGCVIPWPIYYEAFPGERFSVRSQRFVDVIGRADPALHTASIQGFNALAPIAQAAGIVLCALGMGVTEMSSLIDDPAAWENRLQTVEREYPETAPAVEELRTLGRLTPRERHARIGSLRSKLSLFRFHPNFRAIFGATTPGIDWQEVVAKKQAVLIDFRAIESAEVKKFCLLWVYASFLTFIKRRGHNQMDSPISFMIDELTYLIGTAAVKDDLLTADINEVVSRIARSHGVWLSLATQELFQLPEQIRQTVLSMGTVLFGQTSDSQTALALAERYYRYDPYLVKKEETRWHTVYDPTRRRGEPPKMEPVEPTVEYTRDEQTYLKSRKFLDLQPFHYLIGQSSREGELPTSLQRVSLEHVDAGEYPDRDTTDKLRSLLMRRDGRSEDAILREIAQRLAPAVPAGASDVTARPCAPPDEAALLNQSPPTGPPARAVGRPRLPSPPRAHKRRKPA